MPTKAEIEDELIATIAGFQHDPLGFVLFAFPWGEAGTELEGHTGPRQWQCDVLCQIGEALQAGKPLQAAVSGAMAAAPVAAPSVGWHMERPKTDPIKIAVASGHGIGKSAFVSWIVLWAMSTYEGCKGVVTANTEAQLRTKTWPELAKWHRLAINAHWFRFTATSLASMDPKHEKTWRTDSIPWSETNTEAFAGLHNQGRRLLLVFDEASAIADAVWEVAEGALTDADTEIIWAAFGNPTRNSGRFRECFGRLSHRWNHRQIDSRTVEGTNQAQFQQWVEDYGEDSDFVRVRIRGQFPSAGSMQFIPSNVIDAAMEREEVPLMTDPVVLGVDVARYGDHESVIQVRRGRDARSVPTVRLRGVDLMTLAGRVAEIMLKEQADAVFVDATGVGGGVIDRLRQLGLRVIEVHFGGTSDNPPPDSEPVANKAAEMWAKMRTWLRTGGAIERDHDLKSQLESREYGYNVHNEIVLERKDDMKKRGLSSPDRADALALTFAYPVAPRGADGRSRGGSVQQFARREYEPF
jgi:hypothetical protein